MLRDTITLPISLGQVNEINEISCENLFGVIIKHLLDKPHATT